MAAFFDRLFRPQQGSPSPVDESNRDDKIKVAACVVLIEAARSDDHFSGDERKLIVDTLKREFSLNDEEAGDLIALAGRKIDESIDTWNFTNTLNQHLSEDERIKIMETIWKIIYLDDHLHQYEDTLVHKLSYLLGLTHEQLINAKLKIRPL